MPFLPVTYNRRRHRIGLVLTGLDLLQPSFALLFSQFLQRCHLRPVCRLTILCRLGLSLARSTVLRQLLLGGSSFCRAYLGRLSLGNGIDIGRLARICASTSDHTGIAQHKIR